MAAEKRPKKITKPYEMHVIPNTHWDREWQYSFQETRMLLVDFMDGLLAMLEAVPEYHYLLDSQTVPLEDYLEVRPENRARLEKVIANGQLEVGPWYTAPEPHNINGESMARNLLIGHRVAREFGGKPMKVGYTPFGYGQPSQLPQVYRGFGIDTVLFYRGIGGWDTPKSEFIWESPDGSRVLGSRLGSKGRYNFYYVVWRAMAYDVHWSERQYFWETEGLPFHLCNDQDFMGHYYLLDPQRKYRREKLIALIEELREDEKQHFTTRHLAFMQGMDTTAPDPAEFEILSEAQKKLKGDKIFFSSMSEFMSKVKEEADWDSLQVKTGERRHPGPPSPWTHLAGDGVSSRPFTKMLNTRTENMLQRWAEPFACFSWLLGAEYPSRPLEIAWKYLLINHPHDTISGTGADQLEKDMINRYEQSIGISDGVLRRALQSIQMQIDNSDLGKHEMALTVYNPSPYPRTEVLTAVINIDEKLKYGDQLSLYDTDGKKVPICITDRRRDEQVARNLKDVTLALLGDRVTFQFLAEDIPPLGYKTYVIKPESRGTGSRETLAAADTLENEHLKCKFNSDGTLEMTDKHTGRVYRKLHHFVDDGEAGNGWRHINPPHDRKVTSIGSRAQISLEESTPLAATFKVVYRMKIPVGLVYLEEVPTAFDEMSWGWPSERRTDEEKELAITSYFTLRKGAKSLEVRTLFDNQCRCHRLRVFFPTDIKAEVSNAEAVFDVVQREIERPEGSPYHESPNPTHPHYRFVEINDGKAGFALINDGLREYEVTDNDERAIAITLLRAYLMSLCTVSNRWEMHPEQELTQCFGPHERRYAIYPHEGDWADGEVYREAENFNLPIKIAQVGRHKGLLPKSLSFMELEPSALVLSGVKQAENGKGLVVRLFNPTEKAVKGSLKLPKPVKKARLVTLEELPEADIKLADPRVIPLDAAKKKIVTVELGF